MFYAPCFLDMTSPKSDSNSFEDKGICKYISQGGQYVLRYDHEYQHSKDHSNAKILRRLSPKAYTSAGW